MMIPTISRYSIAASHVSLHIWAVPQQELKTEAKRGLMLPMEKRT